MNKFFSPLAAAALLSLCSAGHAVTTPLTLGTGPNTANVGATGSSLNGLTAYGSGGGGSYDQAYVAPADYTLDKIVWWGYRGFDPSAGTAADNFEVLINGALQSGSLNITVDGVLNKYTLDVVDIALAAGAGVLSILNNEDDFAWLWQGSTNTPWDGVSAFPVAYNLVGTVTTSEAPEPGSLALVALAGMALLATRRAR